MDRRPSVRRRDARQRFGIRLGARRILQESTFRRSRSAADIKVAATPEQLARGAKIARICAACHSPTENPPLTGQNLFGNGGPPVGTMYAANLTPAGEIKDWTDGEVIRAIREGIHKNGRSLIVMPAEVFRNLSDADVQSVVAFLRSQPAAGAPTPPTKLNVVGALLIALVFPTAAQTPITQPVVAPPEGTSADYGKYLVSIAACRTLSRRTSRRPRLEGTRAAGGPQSHDDRSQLDRRAVRSDDSYGRRPEQAHAHGRDALEADLQFRDATTISRRSTRICTDSRRYPGPDK